MSSDETTVAVRTRGAPRAASSPTAIEVRDVDKTFRIPSHRIDSLKERATHPLARREYRDLHALRSISFEVRQGEFFGIVGRNGSGKSTLLKLLASIYRPDRGRIRTAGRLAPFIELGVGFNPELTSRENVVINGVLMGLSRREATRILDSVLEFAGLEEFADLKLKNYSSGMMVRLAFAVMVEAEADIMLVDEVLAVGDASFAQKCMDYFRERRAAGRTIVLVTHDMPTVATMCDRAMLIHDGELQYVGDPEEAALSYYRLNFRETDPSAATGLRRTVPDINARLIDAWLQNPAGERIENVEQGEPLNFGVIVEARRELRNPEFGFHFQNVDGVRIFGFNARLDVDDETEDRIRAGQRARVVGRIENPLLPGRYFVSCWISRNHNEGDVALHVVRLLDFTVYGTRLGPGNVSVPGELTVQLEPGGGP